MPKDLNYPTNRLRTLTINSTINVTALGVIILGLISRPITGVVSSTKFRKGVFIIFDFYENNNF
jgi:hypothetical protein